MPVNCVVIQSERFVQGTSHSLVGKAMVVENTKTYPHGVWLVGHLADQPEVEFGIYRDETTAVGGERQ